MLDSVSSNGRAALMRLDDLSRELHVSCQTIVGWADRHLVDARLGWSLSSENVEVRTIELDESTVDFLRTFAEEYREDTVSRTEARRLLKKIDPRNVKRLIRAGELVTVHVGDDVRISIGSIEDYLMSREAAD